MPPVLFLRKVLECMCVEEDRLLFYHLGPRDGAQTQVARLNYRHLRAQLSSLHGSPSYVFCLFVHSLACLVVF